MSTRLTTYLYPLRLMLTIVTQNCQQLSHAGDQRHFFPFARHEEPVIEDRNYWIAFGGHECRHTVPCAQGPSAPTRPMLRAGATVLIKRRDSLAEVALADGTRSLNPADRPAGPDQHRPTPPHLEGLRAPARRDFAGSSGELGIQGSQLALQPTDASECSGEWGGVASAGRCFIGDHRHQLSPIGPARSHAVADRAGSAGRGCTRAAKRASRRASIASVLANCPVVLAVLRAPAAD
ncbi:MAG: hypothetical protein H6750_08850 [Nitrospiraceae bacterium]|nr:hypothetical protein [Nitrospiraceae bacterium]